MGFVKYTKVGSRIGSPRISIWVSGQIGFNNAAILDHDIKSYKYALVYYDSDDDRMGITLTNNDEEDGITKLIHRKGGGISFSARAFLNTYKVDYRKTIQYKFEYDKENLMFIINPKQKRQQQEHDEVSSE